MCHDEVCESIPWAVNTKKKLKKKEGNTEEPRHEKMS